MKKYCDHCGIDTNCLSTEVVNYEGNVDGHYHIEYLCETCQGHLIECSNCGRLSFDPDFVEEFDCAACQEEEEEY